MLERVVKPQNSYAAEYELMKGAEYYATVAIERAGYVLYKSSSYVCISLRNLYDIVCIIIIIM